jgi:hypothetical protein
MGTANPEGATLWNKSPEFVRDTNGVCRALGLKSFDGLEEPIVRYVVSERQVVPDDFVNIRDMGEGVMRTTLRYREDWWDGDQAKSARDRQRAEIKGLGPHQKKGETFEYGFTFRTAPDFTTHGRFCHVFQVKATDGDHGAPLVVVTLASTNRATVRFISGPGSTFVVAREFNWSPGEWQTVRIRLKVSEENDGELTASINGDEFQGRTGRAMFRPRSTDYRPKWGLYRGVTAGMRDSWVEHKEVTARKL